MIRGTVFDDEARIKLTVRGTRGQSKILEAVIDAGFSSWLTLPVELIDFLELPWYSAEQGILADGSVCRYDVYEANVLWDGQMRPVFVDSADIEPLVGIKMIQGYELKMQVRQRGRVTIKRLNPLNHIHRPSRPSLGLRAFFAHT